MDDKYISWFSCGAASAVATKIALKKYKNVRIIYQDTGSEHPDNKRFLKDCEQWFGQEIEITKSEKYNDIWDVFKKTKWLVGPSGARCTSELKRKVAESIIDWGENQQFEIFGYTFEEKNRMERFKLNNNERKIVCPLIDKCLTKEDTLGLIWKAKIKLPKMYELGYRNNNCIGCVKGGAGYWNKIKKDFPDVFKKMAEQERELNVAINKTYINGKRSKIFLDELPEDMGNYKNEPSISCGLFCQMESDF
tara:strand:- start:86 stop:835 length:750 start_codon:yes stop_codon:yes gene_type:complete